MRFQRAGAARTVVGLDLFQLLCGDGLVLRRHAVVGGALEHREVRRARRDLRRHLHAARPRADETHAFAGEVHPVQRPVGAVVPFTLETLQARKLRRLRDRQAAGGHDAVGSDEPLPRASRHAPQTGHLVVNGGGHAGVELDVAPQVEAVDHMVDVAQDLRLRRVALGPVPFLLQFLAEGIGVVQALHVAARAGVAVPVPGAAHAVAGLQHLYRQAHAQGAMKLVEPGKAGAHDHQVYLAGARIRRHRISPRVVCRCTDDGHGFCGIIVVMST